jgi:hypothetical protein
MRKAAMVALAAEDRMDKLVGGGGMAETLHGIGMERMVKMELEVESEFKLLGILRVSDTK